MKQYKYITSMTGFGRGDCEQNGVRFVAEIRSINHRYLDIQVRCPSGWTFLEEEIKKRIKVYVRRGRVEVNLSVTGEMDGGRTVEVDWALLQRYASRIQEAQNRLAIQGEVQISDLLRIADIWQVSDTPWEDRSVYQNTAIEAVEKGLQSLVQMRRTEGVYLAQDLSHQIKILTEGMDCMNDEAPKTIDAYQKRLQAKLEEWLSPTEEQKERILAEVVLYADRVDISEELTRLASHLEQFQSQLSSKEPVGRRLDFLIQELHREVNTIGSKAQSAIISRQVVEWKAILEKMKEQVQNIE